MIETLNITDYGVGFFEGAESHIPGYILSEAVRTIALNDEITTETPTEVIQNALVTRSLQLMTFYDFAKLAPELFSYKRGQFSQNLTVELIEGTEENFNLLQQNAEVFFDLTIRKE